MTNPQPKPLCSICYGTEVELEGDVCEGCLDTAELAHQIEHGPDDPIRLDAGSYVGDRNPSPPDIAAQLRLIDASPGRHFKLLAAASHPSVEQLDVFYEHGWDFVQFAQGYLTLRRRPELALRDATSPQAGD